MTTLTTKLGTNKGKPRSRIWIEGSRLTNAGFVRGAEFVRVFEQDELRLVLVSRTVNLDVKNLRRYRVAGKGAHPIIDICGKVVTDNFTGTHVVARHGDGIIVITAAA
jgi:hypothetical protein